MRQKRAQGQAVHKWMLNSCLDFKQLHHSSTDRMALKGEIVREADATARVDEANRKWGAEL